MYQTCQEITVWNNFFVIIRLFMSLKKIHVIHCVLDIFDLDTKTLGSSKMSCICFLMMSCYNDSDILQCFKSFSNGFTQCIDGHPQVKSNYIDECKTTKKKFLWLKVHDNEHGIVK